MTLAGPAVSGLAPASRLCPPGVLARPSQSRLGLPSGSCLWPACPAKIPLPPRSPRPASSSSFSSFSGMPSFPPPLPSGGWECPPGPRPLAMRGAAGWDLSVLLPEEMETLKRWEQRFQLPDENCSPVLRARGAQGAPHARISCPESVAHPARCHVLKPGGP